MALFFLFTREIIRFVQFVMLAVAIAVTFYNPSMMRTLVPGSRRRRTFADLRVGPRQRGLVELPTYTSIWRIEKRLYKLYDFRLPMPLPVGQIAVYTTITVPYIVLLTLFGLPFNHNLFWLYVLPPGPLTWLATRPVLESTRLPELLKSRLWDFDDSILLTETHAWAYGRLPTHAYEEDAAYWGVRSYRSARLRAARALTRTHVTDLVTLTRSGDPDMQTPPQSPSDRPAACVGHAMPASRALTRHPGPIRAASRPPCQARKVRPALRALLLAGAVAAVLGRPAVAHAATQPTAKPATPASVQARAQSGEPVQAGAPAQTGAPVAAAVPAAATARSGGLCSVPGIGGLGWPRKRGEPR